MTGCGAGTAPAGITTTVAAGTPAPGPTLPAQPLPAPPARPSATPADVCRQLAVASLTVDTTTTSLAQARRNAARAHGTPRLQALYDGAARGRDPQQDQWQAHQAQVQPTVLPAPEDPDLHDVAGQERSPSRAVAAVDVAGTARGTGGQAAPVQPYRLECLLLADPVRGWLVDDVHTEPQPTVPAAPGALRASPAVG